METAFILKVVLIVLCVITLIGPSWAETDYQADLNAAVDAGRGLICFLELSGRRLA